MSALVQITKFTMIGADERGFTAEFSLPRKQADFVFISRKAGSTSGNTYHLGKTPVTEPKIFILLSGKILFSYRKIGTSEKFTKEISALSIVEVSPHVTHKVDALEDAVLLECNSIKDVVNDRIKEDV